MVRQSVNLDELAAGAVVTDNTSFYHKGGDAKARDCARNNARSKVRIRTRIRDCRMIVWDGEGIDLSGRGRPQHYVLFGCSAEISSPLVINRPDGKLTFRQIAEYVCDVGSRHPDAKHIGYGFRYDQNMVVGTMPINMRLRLHKYGIVGFRGESNRNVKYRIKVIWGKSIRFTRENPDGSKVSVKIDDIVSFFHASFLNQYKAFFPDWGSDEEFRTVIDGKARRGQWADFADLPEIREYWSVEIARMERMASHFRDLMVSAGIYLSDWHGPGAVANFIRREHKLGVHEWGGKEQNLSPAVHSAIKCAYYGGRFEQGLMGRVEGPIFGLDINSAYPYGLTHVPTLREGGTWVPTNELLPAAFAVYRIRYSDPRYTSRRYLFPQRSPDFHPFPHRDGRGRISYPAVVEGWYWAPEVAAAIASHPDRVEIYEGWLWLPATDEKPWKTVLEGLYEQRRAFQQNGNPAELPVKLAINSLYGKMAQRVGWNEEEQTPPRSHTLCIAGYVTSFCRSMIYRVVSQLPPSSCIAIETDAIYTTVSPESLDLPTGIGKGLGQWGLDATYDELMYVQSGVYAAKTGGKWGKLKTRGFAAALVNPEMLGEYLRLLQPRTHWEPLHITEPTSEFIGLGLAVMRSRNAVGAVNDRKLTVLHCQWVEATKEIDPNGLRGKRAHVPAQCQACQDGRTAYETAHTLVTNHGIADKVLAAITLGGELPEWQVFSAPHDLPWETKDRKPWRERADEEAERWVAQRAPQVTVSG